MSLCITDLHLEQPPVTLWRASFDGRVGWVAECACGHRSMAAGLISACVGEVAVHAGTEHRSRRLPAAAVPAPRGAIA